jgi:hypothetical protein
MSFLPPFARGTENETLYVENAVCLHAPAAAASAPEGRTAGAYGGMAAHAETGAQARADRPRSGGQLGPDTRHGRAPQERAAGAEVHPDTGATSPTAGLTCRGAPARPSAAYLRCPDACGGLAFGRQVETKNKEIESEKHIKAITEREMVGVAAPCYHCRGFWARRKSWRRQPAQPQRPKARQLQPARVCALQPADAIQTVYLPRTSGLTIAVQSFGRCAACNFPAHLSAKAWLRWVAAGPHAQGHWQDDCGAGGARGAHQQPPGEPGSLCACRRRNASGLCPAVPYCMLLTSGSVKPRLCGQGGPLVTCASGACAQNQIYKNNEKLDQFKMLMNWNQEELEQWALAERQKARRPVCVCVCHSPLSGRPAPLFAAAHCPGSWSCLPHIVFTP